jgi:hypothetical protein
VTAAVTVSVTVSVTVGGVVIVDDYDFHVFASRSAMRCARP